MDQQAKFVQIASFAVTHAPIGRVETGLFALDEDGNVWAYQFSTPGRQKEQWVPLKTDRQQTL